MKQEIRESISKALRKERSKQNSESILKKYFVEVDMESLSGNEKLTSVFGDHHRNKHLSLVKSRFENKEAMYKVATPVEGMDFLHEDSKAETQNYQDIYNDVLIKEVELIR